MAEESYYKHRYSITAGDMDIHYRMTANAVLLYYQDAWAHNEYSREFVHFVTFNDLFES